MPITPATLGTSYLAGQSLYRSWSKAPSQATGAGIWFDLSMSPGNPPAQYYFATPMTSTALARSTDGGLDHGSTPPSGYQKFLHKILVQTVSAITPITLEVLDYLMYYPGIAMDVGVQNFNNTITLPRYSNSDGVMIMAVEQNPYVGSAQFRVTYTNSLGATGKVTPTHTCNTQTIAGTIATSATATAGAPGRFMSLASGDSGVSKLESVEFLSSDVGLLCLALVKPLATVQIIETTSPCEYDLYRDFGILPEVEDDAYLNMIALPVGSLAGAAILGSLTTVWVQG